METLINLQSSTKQKKQQQQHKSLCSVDFLSMCVVFVAHKRNKREKILESHDYFCNLTRTYSPYLCICLQLIVCVLNFRFIWINKCLMRFSFMFHMKTMNMSMSVCVIFCFVCRIIVHSLVILKNL